MRLTENAIFMQDILYMGLAGLSSFNVQIFKYNRRIDVLLQEKTLQSSIGHGIHVFNAVKRIFDNLGLNFHIDYQIYLMVENMRPATDEYTLYQLVKDISGGFQFIIVRDDNTIDFLS